MIERFPAPTPPSPMSAPAAATRPETWLASLRPRVRATLNLALALALASGVVLMLQAWLVARVVDAGVVHRAATPWSWLLALLPLFALRFALTRAAERVAFRAGARLRGELRDALLRHVQQLGPGWLRGQSRGEIVASAVDGIEALEAYYARYLPAIGATALVPAAILLVVFPVDWVSGLVLLLTAPLIPLFMWLIGKGAEELNQRQWARLNYLSGRFLDTLQGLTTLKLLGAARREADVVARVSEDYRVSTMRVLRVAFLSSVVLEFLATVSIAVVAVLIGFRLMWGQMSLLPGLFVLLLAPEYYAPLRTMGTVYHLRMDAIGAATRIAQILAEPLPAHAAGGRQLPRTAHALCFDDVHFAWSEGRDALRGCSFDVPAGRVTALIGASGAGKSSVLALLLGFARAQRGSIRVDGVELDALDPSAWLEQLGWVPQQPHLFAASVADNVRLARPDATDAQLREALRAAQADDFVDALPQREATLLGERGAGLSGGQAQRIALARALLRDAPLLLLDEPTANLDAISQQRVLDALAPRVRGRTVLLVAHRLRTLELADHVVLLDAGRVVEQGAPSVLRAAGGAYAALLARGGTP
jgi:ATP-binding cassette subfamily C protein CydD